MINIAYFVYFEQIICKFRLNKKQLMALSNDYIITIYLDKRRAKKDNSYPVKLKIYSSKLKKRKYYSTKISLDEENFKLIMDNEKAVRGENKKTRLNFKKIEAYAGYSGDTDPSFR